MRWLLTTVSILMLFSGTRAADPAGSKEPPPALTTSEVNWLFGYIPGGAWVCHHYVMTNPHPDTVTIIDIDADCDCTHTTRSPIKVPPGESRLFQVLFDTRTYSGEVNRDIRLTTDFEPNPEMYLYYMSVASYTPRTISITPPSTVFIVGKDDQEFMIKNLKDAKTNFKIFIDNDSSLAVSDTEFILKGQKDMTVSVSPLWDRLPTGSHYRCLVMEVTRPEEFFRVAIPVKINKF
jgi:hypothetical protein